MNISLDKVNENLQCSGCSQVIRIREEREVLYLCSVVGRVRPAEDCEDYGQSFQTSRCLLADASVAELKEALKRAKNLITLLQVKEA